MIKSIIGNWKSFGAFGLIVLVCAFLAYRYIDSRAYDRGILEERQRILSLKPDTTVAPSPPFVFESPKAKEKSGREKPLTENERRIYDAQIQALRRELDSLGNASKQKLAEQLSPYTISIEDTARSYSIAGEELEIPYNLIVDVYPLQRSATSYLAILPITVPIKTVTSYVPIPEQRPPFLQDERFHWGVAAGSVLVGTIWLLSR